jgi:hypothetical protein
MLSPEPGEDDNITGTVTDDANNTSDPTIVPKGGIDTTGPNKPTVTTEPNPDGTLTVTGTADPGSLVTVRFPDGSTKTVKTDPSGHYIATSDHRQQGGDVVAYATDAAGNRSDETREHYSSWYREEEDDGTSYIYEEENNGTIRSLTHIHIAKELEIVREEGDEGGDIRLYVQLPASGSAAGVAAQDVPEGCDLESYTAFAKLYKEDGAVATGFAFTDPACAGVSDATLYEGKPLRFVPGSKVRMEKDTTGKGDAVIIIDAQLTEETRFGEK